MDDKPSSGPLDSVRVLNRSQTIEVVGVSEKTWERLERDGDVPTKTRLSQGRIGYRVIDIERWLDARREGLSARELVDSWKPLGEAGKAVAAKVRP